MEIIKPVVVSLAALSFIADGRVHVEVHGFEPEPEPRAPFNVVMTATAVPVIVGSWLSTEIK
jgi:hypothetical protein